MPIHSVEKNLLFIILDNLLIHHVKWASKNDQLIECLLFQVL